MAQTFDLISSEYNWDDEVILDKTLRRIRQILAAISIRKQENQRLERLMLSWQTRSLAMVIAAAGSNSNEELMKYASNLTIDNEEYELFSDGTKVIQQSDSKVPVHASTQDAMTQKNFDSAADRNSFEMLALFSKSVEEGPPGQ